MMTTVTMDSEQTSMEGSTLSTVETREQVENEERAQEESISKEISSSTTMDGRKRKIQPMSEEQAKRSKRMFGLLVGTLTKNKGEENSETNIKRQQLQTKLQEKLLKEKQELEAKLKEEAHERKLKFEKDKREANVNRLTKMNETIKQHYESLSLFLETKTEPCLLFCPKKHNPKTLVLLEESKAKFASMAVSQSTLYNVDEILQKEDKESENKQIKDVEMSNDKVQEQVQEQSQSQEQVPEQSQEQVQEQSQSQDLEAKPESSDKNQTETLSLEPMQGVEEQKVE